MREIATVTLNPALDEAVALESLILGGKNRCSLDSLDAGGKGVNASRVITRLGRRTIAYGFAGGLTGDLLRNKLRAEGVPHELFSVEQTTRVNIMIYERSGGRRSRLYLPGARVDPARLADLNARLDMLPACSLVILGGSVPPGLSLGVYRDLIAALKARGVRCIVDTSGEALAQALPERPALIKPNAEEAAELLQRSLLTDSDVLAAARELRALGAERVVISQGAEGAVGVDATGAWKAVAPRIDARATVGSGDSMVAGLAIALNEGGSLVDGLRLGTAAGAATAMMSGTQLCLARDVTALVRHVRVRELRAAA